MLVRELEPLGACDKHCAKLAQHLLGLLLGLLLFAQQRERFSAAFRLWPGERGSARTHYARLSAAGAALALARCVRRNFGDVNRVRACLATRLLKGLRGHLQLLEQLHKLLIEKACTAEQKPSELELWIWMGHLRYDSSE